MSAPIGVVDTTFARIDMGAIVESTLMEAPAYGQLFHVLRRTVPGFKDLAVEAKILIDKERAAVVVACGWVGGADLDLESARVASMGLMSAQLMTNTHILEVFVHEREKSDPRELHRMCQERCRQHALNAVALLGAKDDLTARAGLGVRQGDPDAGPLPLGGE